MKVVSHTKQNYWDFFFNKAHVLLSSIYHLFKRTLACRRLQVEINLLKQLKERELEKQDGKENCCSETDTEGSLRSLDDGFNACGSPETLVGIEEADDDVPLTSLLKSSRSSPKIRPTCMGKEKISSNFSKVSPRGSSKSACNQEVVAGRKRLRVVLSDDEDAMCTEVQCSKSRTHSCLVEDVATSYESRFEL